MERCVEHVLRPGVDMSPAPVVTLDLYPVTRRSSDLSKTFRVGWGQIR